MPEVAATISRAEVKAAFVEAPFLPDASQMRVNHITALLALLLEDPLRYAAINLMCKRNSPEDAAYIWSQWEPHIQLPPSHLLAEADLARDSILAMPQAAYTTPEPIARDTHAPTYLVSMAIPVETCILFTAITLREEEMVTHTPPHLHPISGLLAFLSLAYGALATVLALLGLLTRQRVVDPRRPHDSSSRLTLVRAFHQSATLLSPLSLPLPGEASCRLAPPDTHVRVYRSHVWYTIPYALFG
jgi:hypothetical protein